MSRTSQAIAVRFQKILEWATLSPASVEAFERHAASVERALEAGGARVNRLTVMGSVQRGTAVAGSSDIDLLAVLERKDVTWGGGLKTSDTVLNNIRQAIGDRFQSTAFGRDGQAIVVAFGDGKHPVDVVPAFYDSQGGPYNHPIYGIPDGAGGWMRTSPSSHNKYIGEGDARAGHHLTGVARIFKFWRATRAGGVPISGFHVEMLMAAHDVCVGVRPYSAKFADLLTFLARRECAALNDPVQISGRISAASSDAKRNQAIVTVADSAVHAQAAVAAEEADNFQEAMRQWDIVFKGYFPK